MRKRHRTIRATCEHEHNYRKSNSLLFLSEMIAQLERTLSTEVHNEDLTQNPQNE